MNELFYVIKAIGAGILIVTMCRVCYYAGTHGFIATWKHLSPHDKMDESPKITSVEDIYGSYHINDPNDMSDERKPQ